MPPVPELGQIVSEVGPQEIVRHVDSHTLSYASGDVDTAAEIRVDLYHIEQEAHKDSAACVFRIVIEDLVDKDRCSVRDHQFLEKAPQNQLCPVGQIFEFKSVPFIELSGQLVVPADRSLNDLWEEGCEQGELGHVPVRLDFVPVKVEYVRCRLERIEGYSQWNEQASRIEQARRLQIVPEVLQCRQNSEVENEDQCNHLPLAGLGRRLRRLLLFPGHFRFMLIHIGFVTAVAPADVESSKEGYDRRSEQKNKSPWARQEIKGIARCKEPNPSAGRRDNVIDADRYRRKY